MSSLFNKKVENSQIKGEDKNKSKTVQTQQKHKDKPQVVNQSQSNGQNTNIIEVFSQMAKENVRMEVPEYGFMLKRHEDSYEQLIRFNFQALDKSNKQTGFGSYYLSADRMLFLITSLMNGTFDTREAASRAKGGAFPDPIFEDEKPVQGGSDEYKFFAVLPGMKEGKILVRYICRNLKTKKQIAKIQIPFDKDVFIGKMMQIYMQMMKTQ